ncbi:hypothetical protein AB0I72_01195 [Nocardiopsis sp. NPDC049922]|uniref:hypothetical protein n=1 Tax=Nocardiopsis sp. NPDC049922 TaxID=3155157 RepID=UPI0033D82CBA
MRWPRRLIRRSLELRSRGLLSLRMLSLLGPLRVLSLGLLCSLPPLRVLALL